ncbi:MAG: peptidoglycan DD-metalloendopeptidase family protein [Terriglobales bacterium]
MAPAPPRRARIPRGATWVEFLKQTWGLPASQARAMAAAARPIFDLGHIQTGQRVTLWTDGDGQPRQVRYTIDRQQALLLTRTAGPAAGWTAQLLPLRYQTEVAGVSGTVRRSLFAAVEAAGERDVLALKLARIFGWDLDFYTDTRPGDTFRVVVEKLLRHGRFIGYGPILAAEYVNRGHAYQAVRFVDGDGLPAYYSANGQPLKREFLRSPLKFVALRVTSAFSYDRFHPILKIWRPHLGVDYGAPMGTPVQAIGNGRVVFAGRRGEAGNMIRLQHANGYQTLYLHLSKILVHVGQRVQQGQTIGRVGMTGLATGPHLDFRITHFGRYENFQTLRRRLPPAAPVPATRRAAFAASRRRWLGALRTLPAQSDAVLHLPAPAPPTSAP